MLKNKLISAFLVLAFVFGSVSHGYALSYLNIDSDTTCEEVQRKIQNGADVNKKINGVPPLIEHVRLNQNLSSCTAEMLLKAGADFNATDEDGRTALMTYFIEHDSEQSNSYNSPLLNLLIQNSDVTKTDKYGKDALYYAAFCIYTYGKKSVCVDPDNKDYQSVNLFLNASTPSDLSYNRVIESLINKGAKVDKKVAESIMCSAVNDTMGYDIKSAPRNLKLAEQMLPYIPDIEKVVCDTGDPGEKYDLLGVARGSMEATKWVLANIKNRKVDYTCAMWENIYGADGEFRGEVSIGDHKSIAEGKKYFEVLDFLLNQGADINAPLNQCHLYSDWNNDYTILHKVISDMYSARMRQGYSEIIKYLINKGAELNFDALTSKTRNRQPVICEMALHNDTEFLELAFAHGANPNLPCFNIARNKYDYAVHRAEGEVLETLIKHGADVNVYDFIVYNDGTKKLGETPLCYDVDVVHSIDSRLEDVDILLENGADPNLPCYELDKNFVYPLHRAVSSTYDYEYPEIVKLLIEHGANVNALTHEDLGYENIIKEDPPLCYSKDKYIEVLLEHGADPNAICTNTSGKYNVIHHASGNILKALIEHGANVNSYSYNKKGEKQKTPLCTHEDEEDVEILLEHGVDPNLPCSDYDGGNYYPLLCRVLEHKEMVKILLEHGADPNLPCDVYERTPIDKTSNQEIKDLINKYKEKNKTSGNIHEDISPQQVQTSSAENPADKTSKNDAESFIREYAMLVNTIPDDNNKDKVKARLHEMEYEKIYDDDRVDWDEKWQSAKIIGLSCDTVIDKVNKIEKENSKNMQIWKVELSANCHVSKTDTFERIKNIAVIVIAPWKDSFKVVWFDNKNFKLKD